MTSVSNTHAVPMHVIYNTAVHVTQSVAIEIKEGHDHGHAMLSSRGICLLRVAL